MSTPARLAGFVALAAVVFAVALGVGRWVGPVAAEEAGHGHDDRTVLTPADGAHGDHGEDTSPGLELALTENRFDGGGQQLVFTIRDAVGAPVTAYDVQHEKRLHLIAVRRDLVGYRHLHPELDEATGEWRVDTDLPDGTYRLYADFLPTGGEAAVAEADIEVGSKRPTLIPPVTDTAVLPDFYVVHAARNGDEVTFHVTRNGEDVTDLEPYLGAYGHLVAIRATSLDYLHAHPEEGGPGPEVGFHVELTEPGTYALWFDFKHDGEVRTAQVVVEQGTPPADTTTPEGSDHDH